MLALRRRGGMSKQFGTLCNICETANLKAVNLASIFAVFYILVLVTESNKLSVTVLPNQP